MTEVEAAGRTVNVRSWGVPAAKRSGKANRATLETMLRHAEADVLTAHRLTRMRSSPEPACWRRMLSAMQNASAIRIRTWSALGPNARRVILNKAADALETRGPQFVEAMMGTPAIREIDLNPVLLYPKGQGAVALDALIVSDPS